MFSEDVKDSYAFILKDSSEIQRSEWSALSIGQFTREFEGKGRPKNIS